MQPSRLPPHIFAIVLTASLLLFLGGLVAAKIASEGTRPVAPTAPFLAHPR
jgi:hypothetical protein